MVDLGVSAPPFHLPAANPGVAGGAERGLDDYAAADALVVIFTCNHCPYARHVEDTLIRLAHEFKPQGVDFVAISPNDPVQYPDDNFENMAKRAKEKRYPFAYLRDEAQDVARAYGAVCTPDVFVFDRERKLVYRGRVDESRPGMGESDGHDLRKALEELLEKHEVTIEQVPSMGCNIKWKAA
jgi:peroxiredoxin